jgi:preprotein translocase subunit Sec63
VNYVIAGYSIVLGLLFLYAVQLIWRRRRLNRLVALTEADVAADQRAQDEP